MSRRRVRWRRVLVLLLVVLVAGGVAAEVRYGVGRGWVEEVLDAPDPLIEPAEVESPGALALPEFASPAPVAPVDDAPERLVPAAVRRAVAPALRDDALGPHAGVVVAGLAGAGVGAGAGAGAGGMVTRGDRGRFVPASTTKLLTATAALAALGPGHTFTTRAVLAGRRVVLVGGGDPYLASRPAEPGPDGVQPAAYPSRADVASLARLTAAALRERGRRTVSVGYDDFLFTGPRVSPHWRRSYVPDEVVAPITALWVDGGRPPSGAGRVPDPSLAAARVFADVLRAEGLRLRGGLAHGPAAESAPELAAVTGAPLEQVVAHMLDVSDNEAAEVLAHHVGLAVTGEGSFAGARVGVANTLDGVGVDLSGDRVYDGSGLSRRSRVGLGTLVDVLRVAAGDEHPELRPVVAGLPVAGFTGSLELRFDGRAAVGGGVVRAKTGTLTGVSGLAGVVTDATGEPLVFATIADRVAVPDTLAARAALDRLAASLAACTCTAD